MGLKYAFYLGRDGVWLSQRRSFCEKLLNDFHASV